MKKAKEQFDDEIKSLPQRIKFFRSCEKLHKQSKRPYNYKLLQQKMLFMTWDKQFEKETKKFRDEFKISQVGFDNYTKAINLAEKINTTKIDKYNEWLNRLMKQFDIGLRWQNMIEYYFWHNKIGDKEILPKSVDVDVFMHPRTSEPALCIEIYPETQQKDILDFWKVIEAHQALFKCTFKQKLTSKDFADVYKNLQSKKERVRKLKVLKRYKRAYELRHINGDKKMPHKQIAEQLKKEKYLKNCTYTKAREDVREFEKIKNNTILD